MYVCEFKGEEGDSLVTLATFVFLFCYSSHSLTGACDGGSLCRYNIMHIVLYEKMVCFYCLFVEKSYWCMNTVLMVRSKFVSEVVC